MRYRKYIRTRASVRRGGRVRTFVQHSERIGHGFRPDVGCDGSVLSTSLRSQAARETGEEDAKIAAPRC